MDLIKRNGSHLLVFPSLFFDDVFGCDLFNRGKQKTLTTSTTLPSVNIKETVDNYEVEIASATLH